MRFNDLKDKILTATQPLSAEIIAAVKALPLEQKMDLTRFAVNKFKAQSDAYCAALIEANLGSDVASKQEVAKVLRKLG